MEVSEGETGWDIAWVRMSEVEKCEIVWRLEKGEAELEIVGVEGKGV